MWCECNHNMNCRVFHITWLFGCCWSWYVDSFEYIHFAQSFFEWKKNLFSFFFFEVAHRNKKRRYSNDSLKIKSPSSFIVIYISIDFILSLSLCMHVHLSSLDFALITKAKDILNGFLVRVWVCRPLFEMKSKWLWLLNDILLFILFLFFSESFHISFF